MRGSALAPTADETGGLQDLLLPLFLTPQVGERVDDDAKDEVEDDDDDDEEEEQVVNHAAVEQGLLGNQQQVCGVIYSYSQTQ